MLGFGTSYFGRIYQGLEQSILVNSAYRRIQRTYALDHKATEGVGEEDDRTFGRILDL